LPGLLQGGPEDAGLWLEQADLAWRAKDRKLARESLARVRKERLDARQRAKMRGLCVDLGEYRAALELEPDPLEQAELARRAGDRTLALEALARARQRPLDARELARARGMYAELGEYRAALELHPGLLEQADLAARAGERRLALESLARARAGKLDAQELARARGIYAGLGEYRPALALLQEALPSSPEDSKLWLEQADLAARAGDRGLALESLERARAFGRKDDRLKTALIYQELRMFGPALELLRRLAEEQPGNAGLLSELGVCLHLSGATPEAIRQLRAAIALDPDRLPAYLTLGYIYTESRRDQEARDVYSAALARPPAPGQEALRRLLTDARGLLPPDR
ncbi:MAG: tetratricopeptide repeat protein, partial [Elusimicrobia bacterium]|nr:tetratricopeptide repeat protein [Elusimicrobiota bacterium]